MKLLAITAASFAALISANAAEADTATAKEKWGGFYIAGDIGSGSVSTGSQRLNGVGFGGFAGANLVLTENLLIGLEAGYTISGMKKGDTKVNNYRTFGTRVGVINDNVLFYAESGLFAADVTAPIGFGITLKDDSGFYGGIGIDYAMNDNLAIGVKFNQFASISTLSAANVVSLRATYRFK